MGFDWEVTEVHQHVRCFPDASKFLSLLEEFWSDVDEIFVARAPGRLDVMGGISDYSGGLVMQLPIKEACFAAVCFQSAPKIHVTSFRPSNEISNWECSAETIDALTNYQDSRRLFLDHQWVGYIVGCLIVLKLESYFTRPFPGIRIVLSSTVPEGKGVSSSACIEVATMKSVVFALGLDIPDLKIAALSQRVENRIVGSSCGIMDQMTAALGRRNQLMKLRCDPCTLLGHVPIPHRLTIAGIDSGERHSISGSDYTAVRVGAFMGRTILQTTTDRSIPYLAGLTSDELDAMIHRLPTTIKGSEFLERYGSHLDPETIIDPEVTYAVRGPTQHPVLENARAEAFCRLLEQSEHKGEKLGSLMQASHDAYTYLGLDAPGTTQLNKICRDRSEDGIYGAKISGGGSGGTVCLLLSSDRCDVLEDVRLVYRSFKGMKDRPIVFTESSEGAEGFGILRIKCGKVALFRGDVTS